MTDYAANNNTKILLVIATEKECDFRSNNDRIDILFTGMGKVNALVELSNYFNSRADKYCDYIILNIGTCGSPSFPIGSIVIPNEIHQGDTFIESLFLSSTTLYNNKALEIEAFKDYPHADLVLTSDQFINASSPIYHKFKDKNILFEMEAYAIASYAAKQKIPFYAIKCVSDNCDGTLKDWEQILNQFRPDIDKNISIFCNEILKKDK